MSQKRDNVEFEEQVERIHCAAGTRTQVQLTDFLGIKQSSISDAIKRQSIPSDWLLQLLSQKGINPDWILSGQGSRLLVPSDVSSTLPMGIKEIRPPEACTAQELVTELVRRSLDAIVKKI